MSAFDIYLISLVDEIKLMFFMGPLLYAFWSFLLILFRDEDWSNLPRMFKRVSIFIAVMWSIGLIMPKSRTVAAMYVIPAIVNNEHIKEIPNNVAQLTNEWMKKQLDDIAKEKQ